MLELKDKYGNGIKTFRHITEAVSWQYKRGGGTLYRDDKRVGQKELIFEAMKLGIKLDKWKAMRLNNCMTLSQRIDQLDDELKAGLHSNWRLVTEIDKGHNNAAVYSLKYLSEQIDLFL